MKVYTRRPKYSVARLRITLGTLGGKQERTGEWEWMGELVTEREADNCLLSSSLSYGMENEYFGDYVKVCFVIGSLEYASNLGALALTFLISFFFFHISIQNIQFTDRNFLSIMLHISLFTELFWIND